jgi:hypothetical protein
MTVDESTEAQLEHCDRKLKSHSEHKLMPPVSVYFAMYVDAFILAHLPSRDSYHIFDIK